MSAINIVCQKFQRVEVLCKMYLSSTTIRLSFKSFSCSSRHLKCKLRFSRLFENLITHICLSFVKIAKFMQISFSKFEISCRLHFIQFLNHYMFFQKNFVDNSWNKKIFVFVWSLKQFFLKFFELLNADHRFTQLLNRFLLFFDFACSKNWC